MSHLFLPFIFRFYNNTTTGYNDDVSRQNTEHDPNQETSPQRERIILVNPFTQALVVMEGASNSNALLRGRGNKDGHPPASKASMETVPSTVEISEGESVWFAWRSGSRVIKLRSRCLVCRYKMPVDDDEEIGKKREIWVGFSSHNGRGNQDF